MANALRQLAIATITGLGMSSVALAIEGPNYSVSLADDRFEIRDYDPSIIAETPMSADRSTNKAFQRLAGYIFGDNRAADERGLSEEIAMTSPVTTHQSDDGWVMRFTMPSKYSMDDLPRPNDESVLTMEDPGGRYAVVRFSGSWDEDVQRQRLAELLLWMSEQGLAPSGAPVTARYDPPWTPAPLRRNEILIPIAWPADDKS